MRPIFRALAVLALASLVAAPAAQAEDVVTPADLAGTWQWQQSVGSIAGTTEAPGSDEFVQIEFSVDGKLRASHDGHEIEGSYELGPAPAPATGQVLRIVGLPADLLGGRSHLDLDLTVTLLPPGALRLDEPCCDNWSHTFTFEASGLLPVLPVSLGEFKLLWGGGAQP